MKKKISAFLSLLLIICSCFIFVACDEVPKQYSVVANVRWANYGKVEGGGTFNENDTCTLIATPKDASEFVAWVHNGNVVVSYDKTFSFPVNNTNSGVYTAIFTTPNNDLISPKLVTLDTHFDFVSSMNIQIKLGESYGNLYEVYNGAIPTGSEIKIENTTLVFPNSENIYCEVNLTLTTQAEGEEPVSLTEKTNFVIETMEEFMTNEFNLNVALGITGTAKIKFLFEEFSAPKAEEQTAQEE